MNGAIIIEGHVQGLSNVRALGEVGIPIYVIDTGKCLAQFSKYCIKYFKCPDYSSAEFIDFLIELGKKESLHNWTLIPSNDHIVENLSNNLSRLKPYYLTLSPDPEILYNIINKRTLLSIASHCNTPIPKTCYPDNMDQLASLRFPVLLKGTLGLTFYKSMHVKAVEITNREDFVGIFQSVLSKVGPDDLMIQELIPYDEKHKVVSFTCFAERGIIKSFWMGVKLHEHPVRYGTATLSKSVLIPELLQNATPLIAMLNYTGVCEIEFLRDPRDGIYKLIEINPRTWLWVGLAKSCGVNYALMIYNYLNGITNVYPLNYAVDVKWINWITDSIFSIKAIISGKLNISSYLKSLNGKKVKAIFSLHDLLPGIVFPFMSFYIAKTRK